MNVQLEFLWNQLCSCGELKLTFKRVNVQRSKGKNQNFNEKAWMVNLKRAPKCKRKRNRIGFQIASDDRKQDSSSSSFFTTSIQTFFFKGSLLFQWKKRKGKVKEGDIKFSKGKVFFLLFIFLKTAKKKVFFLRFVFSPFFKKFSFFLSFFQLND